MQQRFNPFEDMRKEPPSKEWFSVHRQYAAEPRVYSEGLALFLST